MPTVLFVPLICVPLLEGDFSLISIGDPGQANEFAETHPGLLRLEFHDIPDPIPNEGYVHFTYFMAINILTWLKEQHGKDIVVHCQGGISRSAAVAKFMVGTLGYEKKEFDRCTSNDEGYNSLVYHQLRIANMDLDKASGHMLRNMRKLHQ